VFRKRAGSGRRIGAAFFCFLFIHLITAAAFVPVASANTAGAAPQPLSLAAESAILIDFETGQVLYEKNADMLLPPASMVKMMTEYLVLEAISQNRIGWDSVVTISRHAAATGGSGIRLAEGHRYTVKDLFRHMSINSSNPASVALAEYVGGTEENFVAMMNAKGREFGLSDGFIFINSTGLPEDNGDENLFTARDAAILARRLIRDHPEILEFSSIPRATERESDPNSQTMDNWNRMLEGWKDFNNYFSAWAYEGLDGLKTGHTDAAGWCFTGTAVRDGVRLISVVMRTGSEEERFEETRKLLDYGFNNFERQVVLVAKSSVEPLTEVEISKGKETKVAVVAETGVELIVPKGTTAENFVITAEAVPEDQRVAPIEAGQKLGTATITYAGPNAGMYEPITINLIAAQDVEKAGWFKLLLRAIGKFFGELFGAVKNLF